MKWHEKGVAILKKLDDDRKLTDKNSREMLGTLRRNLAASKLAAEAMKDLGFAKQQDSKELATDLLLLRAGIMARRGDFDDALAAAEELRKLGPEDPKNLYNVARCYALLTRITAKGRLKEEITDKDELSRRETCTKRGIEALTQALEKRYEDSATLLADADLDILRQEPGYVELVKQLKPNSASRDE
jgi:tetratricopeptide (TPR) repeat protein